MKPAEASDTIIREITIDAPAERIFEALTNPEQRLKWWGAEGLYRGTHMESDLRPGGKWITRGVGRDGKRFTVQGTYREIERPRLLVFTWLPDWDAEPLESLVRFDLVERGGVTTVRLTHSGLTTESSRAHHQGWPQVLAWLQAYVEERASDRTVADLPPPPSGVGLLSPASASARRCKTDIGLDRIRTEGK
jgi:uncharacterized protein YndB with AHSA1/START domain